MDDGKLRNEISVKLEKVRAYLEDRQLEGILLSRRDNFAWLSAGRDNHVVNSSESGFFSLLVTPNNQYLVSDNVELMRAQTEELTEYDWEPLAFEWYDPEGISKCMRSVIGSGRFGADSVVPGGEALDADFDQLRFTLSDFEVERYRDVCKKGAWVLESTCRELEPGQSEHEIAGLLGQKAISIGFEPSARLVGTDERVRQYRHPIPTNRKLKKHVLVVFLGQKQGLYVNASRVVHFGAPPDDLVKIHLAACYVDAVYLHNSSVGKSYNNIFRKGMEAYAEKGYRDHWKLFTQGGVIGYRPREFVVTPDTTHLVQSNQGIAWNPTVTGSKCEDTSLVTEDGVEIMTEMADWPMVEISIEGELIFRPDILVR